MAISETPIGYIFFLEWLKTENHKCHNAITIHFVGKNGKNLKTWKHHLAAHDIKYVVHGFLPNDNISELLYKMNIGIATTPFPLIEKSGTVAAMIEHLLPVICIGDEWKNKYSYTMNTSVIDWDPNLTYDLISNQEITRESWLNQILEHLLGRILN